MCVFILSLYENTFLSTVKVVKLPKLMGHGFRYKILPNWNLNKVIFLDFLIALVVQYGKMRTNFWTHENMKKYNHYRVMNLYNILFP